jgi:hypothetical protein
MYEINEKDHVLKVTEIPQSSLGAPLPYVVSNENITVVAYYVENITEDRDSSYVRMVSSKSEDETVCVVIFKQCYAHMFGPPNDEAFSGHPLAERGLMPYGSFIVENSSWIRRLEQMNSVHPYHKPEIFNSYKHYILTFHDSTFECIAESYKIKIFHKTSIVSLVPKLVEFLGD